MSSEGLQTIFKTLYTLQQLRVHCALPYLPHPNNMT